MLRLQELIDRMCTSHHWIVTPSGPKHVNAPLTADMISSHIAGRTPIGLCPIKPGESTCRVALLDFDSHKGEVPWERMVEIARGVKEELFFYGVYVHAFRSRGGLGIHLICVWDAPQDARSVRAVLRTALEGNGLKEGTSGVAKGTVEIYPRQDSVPFSGFGNMFVLPGTGKSEQLNKGQDEWHSSANVYALPPEEKVERAPVDSGEYTKLRSALEALPNDDLDYDSWRNIIFAIHYETEGDGEGHALAHMWSAKSSKYDPEFLDKEVWPYITSSREQSITGNTIWRQAAAAGWTDPEVLEGFPLIEEEPNSVFVKPNSGKFRVQEPGEFLSRPAPRYIIEDVLPEGEVGVIYGESGAGKTFLVLSLAAAISQGMPWRDKKVQQGQVVYVCAEGAGGFRTRLQALSMHLGIDDPNTLNIGVVPEAPNLLSVEDITALGDEIIKFVGVHKHPLRVIVIDTLARTTQGANENSGEDMGKALKSAYYLAKRTGALVLLVHHSGKDAARGARGWSGLRAAAEVEIEVSRVDDARCATVSKLKDGEDGAEYGFRLTTVNVGMREDNTVISSCVLEHVESGRPSRGKAVALGALERRVWQAVSDMLGAGGDQPATEDVITEVVGQLPYDAAEGKRDTRRQRVLRAVQQLIDEGRVLVSRGRLTLAEET